MTDVLKHGFISGKTDGADATQVQPSHWNAGHKFTGGIAGQVLMRDPTDAVFGAAWGTGWTNINPNDVGVMNAWAPAGYSVGVNVAIHWGGASTLTINGIAGGVTGQVVIIRNRGSAGALILLANQSGAATPATNNLINWATSAPTPLAFGGVAIYQYVAAVGWWLVHHEQGAWISPPFSAAEYTGGAPMTWTVAGGNVGNCRYRLSGKTLAWTLELAATTIGGTAGSHLYRALPGGFTQAAAFYGWVQAYGGGAIAATHFHTAGKIDFLRDAAGTVWPVGTLNLNASGSCEVT